MIRLWRMRKVSRLKLIVPYKHHQQDFSIINLREPAEHCLMLYIAQTNPVSNCGILFETPLSTHIHPYIHPYPPLYPPRKLLKELIFWLFYNVYINYFSNIDEDKYFLIIRNISFFDFFVS